MSQILKSLKKTPKANQNKEKSDNKQIANVKKNESIVKREETDLPKEKISEHLDSLPDFCEQLDSTIKNAHEVLQRSYNDDYPRNLWKRLKREVNELLCLQREIKAISDNINSMQMQIAAVKLNIEAHKTKLKVLKSEDRKTRFFLSTEVNKYERNLRNQRDFDATNKYFIAPAGNIASRALAANSTISTRTYPSFVGNFEPENINKSTATNKSISGSSKKLKHPRHKKAVQTDNGVTIYLRPINELEKSESSFSPLSHRSTPNTSIANFSWLNKQDSHAQSDAATDSIISETNSLFVFGSTSHIEDVD